MAFLVTVNGVLGVGRKSPTGGIRVELLEGRQSVSHANINQAEAQESETNVRPQAKALDSYVYFVQSAGGEIKIGTTTDVVKRVNALQTGSPHPLKLLASIPGDRVIEKALHQRFAHLRLSGEWFKPGDDLVSFIHSLL